MLFLNFFFYLDIVLVLLASVFFLKFNHPARVFIHCTYGPSLLCTDFVMCQVNLDEHNLFSTVSYKQLLLCLSFIYFVTV